MGNRIFVQHKQSGEVFIVELDAKAEVIACSEALYRTHIVERDHNGKYTFGIEDFRLNPEDAEWAEGIFEENQWITKSRSEFDGTTDDF